MKETTWWVVGTDTPISSPFGTEADARAAARLYTATGAEAAVLRDDDEEFGFAATYPGDR
jgi:hypothetical protein